MIREIELKLSPKQAFDPNKLEAILSSKLKKSNSEFVVVKRSIDARGKQVKVNVRVKIYQDEKAPDQISYSKDYQDVTSCPEAVIVGAGPAGLFAALRLIELGVKPVIFERGKDVQARRHDLANINKKHIVNPDSNYCFGEGGAGTYSDGKLYTRSKKRGDLRRILENLVTHGASDDILIDAHPHIGTNKLPKIIAAMRQSIIDAGGQIFFNKRIDDLHFENNQIKGVSITGDGQYVCNKVILATGHSARDIFELLSRKKVTILQKPFALGVRVEHNQELIDSIQYNCQVRDEFLPAAPYSLVQQIDFNGARRGVFSFCMCPGGFIVPSATAPGEVVVNGMSPSRRDSKYANSGIVMAIESNDIPEYSKYGALASVKFQADIEKKACEIAGGTQVAPAQRLTDFVNKKVSSQLLDTSYQPGLSSVDMQEVLPKEVHVRLVKAFKIFGKKMPGYLTNEAQLVGVESRTSSPVSIPRDKESLEHVQIKGLYPCGEGAGYAGGIVSAAMDGERCAEKIAAKLLRK